MLLHDACFFDAIPIFLIIDDLSLLRCNSFTWRSVSFSFNYHNGQIFAATTRCNMIPFSGDLSLLHNKIHSIKFNGTMRCDIYHNVPTTPQNPANIIVAARLRDSSGHSSSCIAVWHALRNARDVVDVWHSWMILDIVPVLPPEIRPGY